MKTLPFVLLAIVHCWAASFGETRQFEPAKKGEGRDDHLLRDIDKCDHVVDVTPDCRVDIGIGRESTPPGPDGKDFCLRTPITFAMDEMNGYFHRLHHKDSIAVRFTDCSSAKRTMGPLKELLIAAGFQRILFVQLGGSFTGLYEDYRRNPSNHAVERTAK